jgi:hypothetical protein
MLAHALGQLDRLDQGHPQDVRIEVDGAIHIAANEGQMVDAPELKWLVFPHAPTPM